MATRKKAVKKSLPVLPPADELYEIHKLDLIYTAYKFWRKYGGDINEAISYADECFMDAYLRYNIGKGQFKKWLKIVVWGNLLSRRRRELRNQKRLGKRIPLEKIEDDNSFNLSRFIEDLPSGDARYVTRLVVDPPESLNLPEGRNIRRESMRVRLRSYLKVRGWTSQRVNKAFDEIQSALN